MIIEQAFLTNDEVRSATFMKTSFNFYLLQCVAFKPTAFAIFETPGTDLSAHPALCDNTHPPRCSESGG
ncbi:MAG: hypothetical protein ACR2PH_13765 [Desulfobulbia bacterium]